MQRQFPWVQCLTLQCFLSLSVFLFLLVSNVLSAIKKLSPGALRSLANLLATARITPVASRPVTINVRNPFRIPAVPPHLLVFLFLTLIPGPHVYTFFFSFYFFGRSFAIRKFQQSRAMRDEEGTRERERARHRFAKSLINRCHPRFI